MMYVSMGVELSTEMLFVTSSDKFNLNGATSVTFFMISPPFVSAELGSINCWDVSLQLSLVFKRPDPDFTSIISIPDGHVTVIFSSLDVAYSQPALVLDKSIFVSAGEKCLLHMDRSLLFLNKFRAQEGAASLYTGVSMGHTCRSLNFLQLSTFSSY